MMFRCHRTWALLKRRPATVLFVPACPLLTGVVEQLLPDVLPYCPGSVEAERINLLNLNGPAAPTTSNPQQVSLDLRKRFSAGLQIAGEGSRVCQQRGPIFGRK